MSRAFMRRPYMTGIGSKAMWGNVGLDKGGFQAPLVQFNAETGLVGQTQMA